MFFNVELKINVTMLNEKTSLSQAVRAMRHNVSQACAVRDLEALHCLLVQIYL